IPLFFEAMLAGRSPVVHGDGLQSRDFTYVDNVVNANLLAAAAPRVAGKVYNVACGRRTTLLDLVAAINELLGTRIAPVHTKPRAADGRPSQADTAQAQAALGYCPSPDLAAGLRHCLDYYRARLGEAAPKEGDAAAPRPASRRLSPLTGPT